MVVVDFETEEIIDGSPDFPKPVGVSILRPNVGAEYLAWGHPEGNNTTWESAKAAIEAIWGDEWVTHNGANFDVPLAQQWFDLPPRAPYLTHDTLFMAYLHNPHARSLSLKDLAESWLDMPPDDQKELHDWIVLNVPECKSRRNAGAHISKAPADLVGKYANSDTEMTWELFKYLEPLVETMEGPNNRERRLAPVLVKLKRTGVRCDLPRLKMDYGESMERLYGLDLWIRNKLNSETLNPGSDKELGTALKGAGYTGFLKTPKGADSVSKPSLEKVLESDPELKEKLWQRSTLATLTGTFMEPWIRMAEANGGRVHASYNQVRNPEGYGTRTGRLSSSKPNFQNVPTDLGHDMPVMRSYLLPEEEHVWFVGDFKQQEPRLAAHFEDGALLAAYINNPDMDPYVDHIMEVVQGVSRTEAKVIFLGLLYAMGANTLADKLGCEPSRATMLRNIIRTALPDVEELNRQCKLRFKTGVPIKTIGGRLYHCEPPSNGRTWEYKALNTLIQGSAADQTKEAILYIDDRLAPKERLLGTVHDEVSTSIPEHRIDDMKQIYHEAANALPCDAPMLMDCNWGLTWGEASK